MKLPLLARSYVVIVNSSEDTNRLLYPIQFPPHNSTNGALLVCSTIVNNFAKDWHWQTSLKLSTSLLGVLLGLRLGLAWLRTHCHQGERSRDVKFKERK